ncbi:MAG: hypothetical protein HQ518_04895 [Rhodopirellula sp.]|nr:hypothetical protein [Rhodopirellula sp.]
MKRSEKLLASVLFVSVGLFVVIPWIWEAFRGPVVAQEEALERAATKLEKTIGEFDMARASLQSMRAFKEQSLSSNSAQGALAYQQWLTDLAEIVADFKNAEVTPERISPSRDNSYVAVRLRVTGEGTVEQLRDFLYRFHRANVLHRISSLAAESINNSSRPLLNIRITAEAIALRDAEEKGPTLFPRTTVVSIGDNDNPSQLEVESVAEFPKAAPFELRIGQNYYSVEDVHENKLTLKLDEGQTVEASSNDIVELSVVHPDFKDIAITEYDALIKKNPFAKPATYRPRLDLIGEKSVGRGVKISLEPKVTGIDTTAGEVDFKLLSGLTDGMTFEAGKLNWEPPAELAAGDYTIKVRATGGGLQTPIEAEFKLTLSDVNKPPVITIPENLVATLGQAITTKLAATDPETPAEQLTFALADGAPEGAAFNVETKELTYTPPATGEPGEVTINVTVTDAGSPAQTVTAAVKVTVQDDKAQLTFMEGVVSADAVPEAWLRDKSTNTKMILHEGDDLKYAGFDAVVLSIGDDFLLMQQADETLRLEVGQNLRQSVVIARLDPPKAAATTEAAEDGPAAPPKPEDAPAETPLPAPAKPDVEKPATAKPANPKAGETAKPATTAAMPEESTPDAESSKPVASATVTKEAAAPAEEANDPKPADATADAVPAVEKPEVDNDKSQ